MAVFGTGGDASATAPPGPLTEGNALLYTVNEDD